MRSNLILHQLKFGDFCCRGGMLFLASHGCHTKKPSGSWLTNRSPPGNRWTHIPLRYPFFTVLTWGKMMFRLFSPFGGICYIVPWRVICYLFELMNQLIQLQPSNKAAALMVGKPEVFFSDWEQPMPWSLWPAVFCCIINPLNGVASRELYNISH